MALLDRFIGLARRCSEKTRHVIGKHFAENGRLVGFGPGHFRAGLVMREVVEAELEAEIAAVVAEPEDVAKGFEVRGLAVGGEAHHFVFVAKFQEAEILGDRAVIEAERMGEGDRAVDAHAIAAARAPHGAGEIAEAIGGEQGGVFKRGNEEGAGEMGLMVLHSVKL